VASEHRKRYNFSANLILSFLGKRIAMMKEFCQTTIDLQAIEQLQAGKWCLHSETREQTIKRLRASIAERIDIRRELGMA
jgi:hypothetical protein